ncbi:ATP-binding protein [uncultured Microscilla sp.]|uniref:hybrid sensor histidine kinase/response regulator n=1 Tax=uncultured Microscilla sp. TaxID=432653 RepID=UPI0026330450|nr:ATP-binding protein [uncultured Microscilla sp.]
MKEYSILVIDDQYNNLKTITAYFDASLEPYAILGATSGMMGYRLALDKRPDLIIMDWEMPEMSGIEAVKKLKASPVTKDIPIIMATGVMTHPDDLRTALEAGAIDYVRKPIDKVELLARTRSAIALSESYQQIKLLSDFKQAMTHMLVHDLKNSLGVVMNLSEKPKVIEAGRQMTHLVMNLLDVQKFEDANIEVQSVPYPFVQVLAQAVSQVDYLRMQKNIALDYDNHLKALVLIDEGLILRVLVNLLHNAIKFSPQNSTINVKAEAVKSEWLKVQVSDQGKGIAASHIEKIFDKYYQVEVKNQEQIQSTGLGLTFCKFAIEAHGGKMGVESREGEGSTFWLTLPLSLGASTALVGGTLETASLENDIILTVDDQRTLAAFRADIIALKFYEASKLKRLLNNIPAHSVSVERWKEAIQQSVLNSNKTQFEYLKSLLVG